MMRIKRNNKKAFTFVEVIVASSLFLMISAALMSIFYMVSREQYIGMIQQRLTEHADRVQDFIEVTLMAQSRDAGVSYPNLTSGYATKIAFREGIGMKNKELSYDSVAKALYYDPDMSKTGDTQVIGFPEKTKGLTHLTGVKFWPGMQTGGIPDSSFVNVWVEVSDAGLIAKAKHKKLPQNYPVKVVRNFTVGLRKE